MLPLGDAVRLLVSRPKLVHIGAPPISGEAHKLQALESVRGIAAFAVFTFHFINLFAWQVWTAPMGAMFSTSLGISFAVVKATPLNIFVNPELAVRTFFVLSGFVLSWRFLQERDFNVVRAAAIKRGIRLGIPVVASLVTAFVVFRLLSSHPALLRMDQVFDQTMMRQDVAYTPTWWEIVRQSLKVPLYGTDYRSMNRALWTIHYEFIGSYVVFGVLFLFGGFRRRWIAYVAVAAAAISVSQPFVVDFLIGLALADTSSRLRTNDRATKRCRAWALPSFAVGVLYMIGWEPFLNHGWRGYDVFRLAPAIAAGLVVFGVLHSPVIQWALRFRAVLFLGKISFACYLLHLSVIYGIGGWFFKWAFDASGSLEVSFLVSYAVTLIALVLLATAFTKYVDAPAVELSRRVADLTMARTPVRPAG
jgi:peptidoglycan/LPS O-acetylase OafA/YrhL